MSYDLHRAVLEFLEAATGKPVGLGGVPSARPVGPYVVLQYNGGPPPDGDLGSVMRNRSMRYMVRCVGSDYREVTWLKEKIISAMDNATLPGVQWVTLELDGAIIPDGETLYSCTDTYIVRV